MSIILLNVKHFFFMGGYAFYVWFAYGITFAIFVLNILLAKRKKTFIQKQLNRRLEGIQRESNS